MGNPESIVDLVDITLTDDAGNCLFDCLNFELPAGATAVISGATGSGKTSLVEIIIGARKPESGTVLVFGEDMRKCQENLVVKIRRKIGGVGGVYGLISYRSVYDNLIFPLILHGDRVAFQKAKVEKILSRFNLTAKKRHKAGKLSQGEKVMVMLARAIIADQPLLIIDEPLAGLDESVTQKLTELLKNLSVSGHSMIILTTRRDSFNIPGMAQYSLEGGKLI